MYTFTVGSDDGSKLKIDDVIVVDNDGLHGYNIKIGSIMLQKGVHYLEATYFENGWVLSNTCANYCESKISKRISQQKQFGFLVESVQVAIIANSYVCDVNLIKFSMKIWMSSDEELFLCSYPFIFPLTSIYKVYSF